MDRPRWLDDAPEIRALLAAFLDRLDGKVEGGPPPRAIRIDARRFPELFRFDDEATQQWTLLKSLHGVVIEIELDRRRGPYDGEYAGARVRVLPTAEETLRRWLERPRVATYAEQWREAVAHYQNAFTDKGAALTARPITVDGKTADEVVAAFARVIEHATTGLTLRQLSARCFWGHSKFLDDRADLLAALVPSFHLQPRPIVVSVFLPPRLDGVLFIENQDSYTRAIAGVPEPARTLALVYAAGFRGSAQRIREPAGVSLHYHARCTAAHRMRFESWWFARSTDLPVWFWGDLDYAGLAILKALRARFGDVRAWESGYAPMLARMKQGGGHPRALAGKDGQATPGQTGCAYADEVLRPAIEEHGVFVDQEAVG